jgi:hypothetical protein
MAAMSVANVPGFDVLFPSGSYSTTTPSSSASSSPSSSSGSDSTTAAATAPSQYEQALDSLSSWEYQYLYQETFGSSDSTGLYATAGLSVDAFANLATELQNLGSNNDSTGSTVDTMA